MTHLKDLSMVELATQWHTFQAQIEKLEARLNRMYSERSTKKDLMDILKGKDQELKDRLEDYLGRQEACEYWLRNRGTMLADLAKWNIQPKFESFEYRTVE